ncbi:MAG: hypothetical protein ACLU37_01265 [Collinsella sp.]
MVICCLPLLEFACLVELGRVSLPVEGELRAVVSPVASSRRRRSVGCVTSGEWPCLPRLLPS